MNWLICGTFCALTYVIHDFLLKLAANSLNSLFAAFILNVSASLCLGCYIGIFKGASGFQGATEPILVCSIAGAFLGVASVLFVKTFENGVDFSIGIPFIYVTMILISVVLGLAILGEILSIWQILGVMLSCVGLFLTVRG